MRVAFKVDNLVRLQLWYRCCAQMHWGYKAAGAALSSRELYRYLDQELYMRVYQETEQFWTAVRNSYD